MSKEDVFRVCIRLVFLCAYGAFLWASIHHVAYFFHDFEPGATDWNGSYWLAIAIDVTSLVLTVGVMFFRKSMHRFAFGLVCFFILFLTAFSWLVNYEYAAHFQSTGLTSIPWLTLINPILASSFAFLNVAYSITAEAFGTPQKTLAELEAEATRLEQLQDVKKRIKDARKDDGLIVILSEKAEELKQAKERVFGGSSDAPVAAISTEETQPASTSEDTAKSPVIDAPNASAESDENTEDEPVKDPVENDAGSQAKGPLSVSVKEAATMLGLSESYVRELRSKNRLKAPARNGKLVTTKSIQDYQHSRKETRELPAIKLVPLTGEPLVMNGKH